MSSIHNTTTFPNTFQVQLPTKMFVHDCIFGILRLRNFGKIEQTNIIIHLCNVFLFEIDFLQKCTHIFESKCSMQQCIQYISVRGKIQFHKQLVTSSLMLADIIPSFKIMCVSFSAHTRWVQCTHK